MTIFTSPEGKARLADWHERFRARLGRPTESRCVPTRFGTTHALLCGPPEAPPLVLLHGALASSAHALGEVAALADEYRVYAIDVIGQSPMSAEARPDVNGPAYGEWLWDTLNALSLTDPVRVVAVSWGGFVALRAAALAPERITKLSLVVPAGLVQGAGIEGFTLFTTTDPYWLDYMGDALRDFKLDFRPPRLVRDGELSGLKAPVQVFGAERDLSFPGAALLARAQQVFPNLAHAELLRGARHAPSFEPAARRELTAAIATFLRDET
jgi:Predicted hydrolases or acyltransferases (alpha/beta hydrolase superfamily)